ncbi:hypothetical protein [Thioalkalivibrio sp. ALMg9]|uniref:hypothetical protein n=1 Tax=Thioalkalivibrio sp. ALMg9 TaxID=1266912 RepID=UPI000375CD4E|nr:hypothetical protein [Thioalkalivibrio sp. ALMg9]
MDNTPDESKTAMWVLHGLISALSKHHPSLPWGISEALSTIPEGDLSAESKEALETARQWVWFTFTEKAPPH